jgi:hypothetical protein
MKQLTVRHVELDAKFVEIYIASYCININTELQRGGGCGGSALGAVVLVVVVVVVVVVVIIAAAA